MKERVLIAPHVAPPKSWAGVGGAGACCLERGIVRGEPAVGEWGGADEARAWLGACVEQRRPPARNHRAAVAGAGGDEGAARREQRQRASGTAPRPAPAVGAARRAGGDEACAAGA